MNDDHLNDWVREKNKLEEERYAEEAKISEANDRKRKMWRKILNFFLVLTGLVVFIFGLVITSKEGNQVRWPPTKTPTPTPVFILAAVTDFQQYFLWETLDFSKLPSPQDGELSIEAEGSMFWSRGRTIRIVFWKPYHSVDINGKTSILLCLPGGTDVIHVDMLYWVYYDCDTGRIAVSLGPYALDGTP